MLEKTTIRFYTAFGYYVKWRYLDQVTYLNFKEWLDLGNYFLINNKLIDENSPMSDIFNLLKEQTK